MIKYVECFRQLGRNITTNPDFTGIERPANRLVWNEQAVGAQSIADGVQNFEFGKSSSDFDIESVSSPVASQDNFLVCSTSCVSIYAISSKVLLGMFETPRVYCHSNLKERLFDCQLLFRSLDFRKLLIHGGTCICLKVLVLLRLGFDFGFSFCKCSTKLTTQTALPN